MLLLIKLESETNLYKSGAEEDALKKQSRRVLNYEFVERWHDSELY